MGFAYRHISVKIVSKASKQTPSNPLPARVKTIAEWIRMKRREKRMARYHIAAKMGIATPLVGAWEAGTARPDTRQMRTLVKMLGTYCRPGTPEANAMAALPNHVAEGDCTNAPFRVLVVFPQ